MNQNDYGRFIEQRTHRTPAVKNCLLAFLSGGLICVLGQGMQDIYLSLGAPIDKSPVFASCTLIILAGLLTGLGCFDAMAKVCGAGMLVPITGFSNAMTSPAIEAKNEGFIAGVGAEMFKIAGPVIVYGNLTAALYGLIRYLFSL